MAHDLDLSTGKPAMAYVGKEPWHGLGEKLDSKASIETWIKAAGLEYQILRAPVCYPLQDMFREFPGRQVLFRSDNGKPLSIVSDSFCIVQPKEAVEFYQDLVAGTGFTLETAGALDEGRKVWGLARSKMSHKMEQKDQIDAFLLLASSCDKSLATTVAFTSVRVVCQNTLSFAMDDINGKSTTKCFKVSHDKKFDWNKPKEQLKLIDSSWSIFKNKIDVLAKKKVNTIDENRFFEKLFLKGKNYDEKLPKNAIIEIQNLKSAFVNGIGQQKPATKGTAWGLVNAVTYYVDHSRKSDSRSSRLDSAWFGAGAMLKDKAWEVAVEMFQ
jgi:phage/plasmid-like protein (TIGR03299 family)